VAGLLVKRRIIVGSVTVSRKVLGMANFERTS
jgi:hypothetical protein